MYALIEEALKNRIENSGLKLMDSKDEKVLFAVNTKIFEAYYRVKGDSTALWSSIQNRLTKKKTGFNMIRQTVPPDGYDKVYTHTKWASDHFIKYLTPLGQFRTNLEALFKHSLPVDLIILDPDAQRSIVQNQMLNVNTFFANMQKTVIGMNDSDLVMMSILLHGETNSPVIDLDNFPLQLLVDFGKRYGPWEFLFQKIREFVNDGCKGWFIGKADSKTVEKIIESLSDNNYYVVRSVELRNDLVQEYLYAFALSYREFGQQTIHYRIYKDKEHRFCILQEGGVLKPFSTIREIIRWVIPEGTYSLYNPIFQGLHQNYQSNQVDMTRLMEGNYVLLKKQGS